MPVVLRWTILVGILAVFLAVPFYFLESPLNSSLSALSSAELPSAVTALAIVGALALDVFLPVPSSLVSTMSGVLFGFFWGTLFCWIGMSLGCLVGYWFGATGGTQIARVIAGENELSKVRAVVAGVGLTTVVVTRPIPVLAEAVTIAAGTVGYPIRKFMLAAGLANLGVSMVYAAIGNFAFEANSFALAFAGAIGVPAAGWAIATLYRRSKTFFAPRSINAPKTVSGIDSDALFDSAKRECHDVSFAVQFNYGVHFTNNSLDPQNDTLVSAIGRLDPDKRHKVCVFVDSGFAEAWPDISDRLCKYFDSHSTRLELVHEPITIQGGEGCKESPELVDFVREALSDLGIDRHSFVLCFGGGSVLDLVGFAASTTHRGVRIVRFPTTVLAQNDAGIGVKNAVNQFGCKNFTGTFFPPCAVINDASFLRTLGPRDRRAGVAEAVKVALIRDQDFYSQIEADVQSLAHFEERSTLNMIQRCAILHLDQIVYGGDPFENGSARPLDFGHWAAHKLETATKHDLRHGEAVAIGIALDSRYSVLVGLLAAGQDERICRLLEDLGFRLWHPALGEETSTGRLAILRGLKEFQEHLGGELTVTLLEDIGTGIEVNTMDHLLVADAVAWLRDRQAK